MRNFLSLAVFFVLTNLSSVFGEGQKGNFALTIQGGGFGNLEDRFFKSWAFLVGGGLEYFPINPISAGIQFQFSPKNSFGSPVTLGVGSVSGAASRRSDRLFQTNLFARPTFTVKPAVKFFGLAGVTLTKVVRTSSGEVVATGSENSKSKTNKVGAKFGGGMLVHLKSDMHLNVLAAFDTSPQKLFSTQLGISFFFNPFLSKKLFQSDGNLVIL